MPRKCCVPVCKSNYKTGKSAATFRFPSDEEQIRLWKTAIPRNWDNTPITKNTVVCERHWPPNYEKYRHYGKERPVNPPCLFEGVPPSCITKVTVKRPTQKSSRDVRSIIPDEMDTFTLSDTLSFTEILDGYASFLDGVVAFEEGIRKSVIIQSTMIENGIPRFALEI